MKTTIAQAKYIGGLVARHTELNAQGGVVTYPMVQAGLARRREMGTPLESWIAGLSKTDASWVIGKLVDGAHDPQAA